jgi:hypothetical protein
MYNIDQDAKDRLKSCITPDNGSTLSLFSSPDLVQDIQTSSKILSLATTASVKQSNHKAKVPGFGKSARMKTLSPTYFQIGRRNTESLMIQTKKTHSLSRWTRKLSTLNAALTDYTNIWYQRDTNRNSRRPKGRRHK